MNTEHYKKVLLNKRRELQQEIARFKSEAREPTDGVEDPVDEATTSQTKSTALEENTFASDTLLQVEAALQRIEEGTYGKCQDCGRAIEQARLDAVPWTPYCLQDQQKHDTGNRAASGSTI